MRITGSAVALAAEHSYTRVEETRASLTVRRARAAPAEPAPPANLAEAEGCDVRAAVDADPRLRVLLLLVERLTGHALDLLDGGDVAVPEGAAATPASAAPQRGGAVSVQLDVESTRYEHEATAFAAGGTVTTADGRRIDFRVELAMEREHLEHTELHVRAGEPEQRDPLVLSLDGGPVRLTDWKVAFDLDADGAKESIAFAGTGAAFLALDRNGNGRVDDGTELFGARTGDGFGELAALDADRDGWIDDDDPAAAQLVLWQRTQDGTDTLRTLAEAGVGAIHTGAVATPFTLTGAGGEQLGTVAESGVYLRESGGAGVVQHVDLVV